MSAAGWLRNGLCAEAEVLRSKAHRSRARAERLENAEYAAAARQAADAYEAAAKLLIGRALLASHPTDTREEP